MRTQQFRRPAVQLCHVMILLALAGGATQLRAQEHEGHHGHENHGAQHPDAHHGTPDNQENQDTGHAAGHGGGHHVGKHSNQAGFSFHIRQIAGYNHQSGPRGKDGISAENFQMMVYRGTFGPFSLEPHLMTSLEPWTLPQSGVPQLFQTGETWQGQPLVDRQHPHDLWMEITEKIIYNIGDDTNIFLVGGPVGEPALGPEAFMHRESAQHLPWAPLGHHFQDSTHVTMGVLTAGIKFDIVQVEMSQFNGREPDENRKNIDKGKMDSWSSRVHVYLGDNLKVQASSGILKEPEPNEPGDQRRTTFSVHWNSVKSDTGFQHATSFVHGSIRAAERLSATPESTVLLDVGHDEGNEPLKSWLLETDMTWGKGVWWMARIENLDRVGLQLVADENQGEEPVRNITAITAGTFFDIPALSNDVFSTGLGLDMTGHLVNSAIEKEYGANPFGMHGFLMVNAHW